MPPLAIIAATAAVGAGANIAAGMSNAGAAKSAANANAAAIKANQAADTGLIDAQKQQNADILGAAQDKSLGVLQDQLNRSQDYLTAAGNANQANANRYQAEGQGLYQGTVDRGNAAGSAINALLGIGGDPAQQEQAFHNWANSTGMKFQLQTGADAASSNAATRGLLSSGGTLKALDQYGQQVGQGYFGNYLSGLQGQQSTGLTAANALAGVYGNATNMRNTANQNWASGQAGLATGFGDASANVYQGTANALSANNTNATNALVAGNTGSTNALVGNTNNALSQTISSNNTMANGISGLAGNVAGAYGLSQGLSSYRPNAMAAGASGSSYQLPATGGMAA